MRRLSQPAVLAPRAVPKPWGGRRIETVLRRELDCEGPVGEVWDVYDRPEGSSRITTGEYAGRTLADLRDGGAPYPLLLKMLDARETLSVQVHPGAEAAAELGGEAKTECWFVLQADPGARVYRGLRDDCTLADLEAAITNGTVGDCLHAIEVGSGDTVFVPAGTLHTIGEGVLLAEVQQNSDTTYRVHDWGRMDLDGTPRELHVEQALQALRALETSVRGPDKIPAQMIEDEGTLRRVLLIATRWFGVEHVTAMGTFTLEAETSNPEYPSVLHVLSGNGLLRPFRRGVEPTVLAAGTTVLLPTDHEAYEVELGPDVLRALVVRPAPERAQASDPAT